RGGQRPPAERRVQVVRVNDPRAGPPDGPTDLLGIEPAAEHSRGGGRPAEPGRVAIEQLGVLAELVADQPEQVLDRLLLAAERPVPVVQEENDRPMLPYSGR
ncbi:MAG TPA: hypothetical protein VHW26_10495, partial [Solirubrobacteraceae bacterium]|nr:hypothetical protein [Solirubrobacteraceae bacterium]